MNLWPFIGAVLLALLLGIGIGWKVEGWHADAQTLKQTNAAMADSIKQSAIINVQNDHTAQGMADLLTQLQGQAHAFDTIDKDLASHSLGTCALSPDADRMYQRAYQAVFPGGATNQAGGSHAADPPATDARKPFRLHR
jgi:hypothetical protein